MMTRLGTSPSSSVMGLAIALGVFTLQPPASAQLPTATSTSPQPQVASSYADYLLGPGDEISITVFGYEEYTATRTISPSGTIPLPLIGSVVAAGKTSETLAQELASRLNHFLVEPTVTISIATLRPVFVTITGEVQRPGPVQLQNPNSASSQNRNSPQTGLPTLSSAIMAAGGITPRADLRQVQIKRPLPNGDLTTLTVNLWDGMMAEAYLADPTLQYGDTVVIPQLPADAIIDRRLIARTSLAPETVRVRVVGEVTRPGEVQVPPNSSLSSAVAIAGGPTVDARMSEVNFIRLNDQGQIERQEIDLSNLTDTHQVQEGDVIIVPKKSSSSVVDFAGRALSPLGILLRIFGL